MFDSLPKLCGLKPGTLRKNTLMKIHIWKYIDTDNNIGWGWMDGPMNAGLLRTPLCAMLIKIKILKNFLGWAWICHSTTHR